MDLIWTADIAIRLTTNSHHTGNKMTEMVQGTLWEEHSFLTGPHIVL